jgi:23S rRNA pseudouridine1911/1915/1917 synthase
MALAVVYEDEHLLVLDKPAGLVVHPAPGNWSGTLLNGLLAHHAGAAALPRAGIVHRLDKDTSGVMMVGKTLPAVTALVREIAAREVHRSYLALAHGVLARRAAAHRGADRPRPACARAHGRGGAGGKPARTDVERLAVRDGAARCAARCTPAARTRSACTWPARAPAGGRHAVRRPAGAGHGAAGAARGVGWPSCTR